jgi:hypothetical protein
MLTLNFRSGQVLCFALFLICPTARGDEALLEEVRAGNFGTLASLQTLQCDIIVSDPVMPDGIPPRPARSAKYWWASGASRSETRGAFGTLTCVQREGVVSTLTQPPAQSNASPASFRRRAAKSHEPLRPFDAWELGLLTLCGPGGFPQTLEELIAGEQAVTKVDRGEVDGCKVIVVALQVAVNDNLTGDFEFCFDPALNYLARQRVTTFPGEKRRETKVHRFRECAPTLYFPEYVETHYYQGENLIHHQTVEFKNIRVNEPIPPSWFEIVPPPGAFVSDEIVNQQYEVKPDGSAGTTQGLIKPAPVPQSSGTYSAPTSSEPYDWTWWIVLSCSAAILALAVGLWLYGRR